MPSPVAGGTSSAARGRPRRPARGGDHWTSASSSWRWLLRCPWPGVMVLLFSRESWLPGGIGPAGRDRRSHQPRCRRDHLGAARVHRLRPDIAQGLRAQASPSTGWCARGPVAEPAVVRDQGGGARGAADAPVRRACFVRRRLGAGAALGWWPRPGSGGAGSWPIPAMTTVAPQPLEIYRDGLVRFIELGDEAVSRLSRVKNTGKGERP